MANDASAYRIGLKVALTAALLAGCSISSGSLGSTGPSSRGGASNKQITIPGMMFMSEAEARSALERAGHEGTVSLLDGACGSAVDGRIIEQGMVCYQAPPAGRVQGDRLSVQIRVQTEDPRHGNLGRNTEWHLMPNVVGMPLDQAMPEMTKAGFTNTERIRINRVNDDGCQPNHVCSTYPKALERSGQNSDKVLSVGAEPVGD